MCSIQCSSGFGFVDNTSVHQQVDKVQSFKVTVFCSNGKLSGYFDPSALQSVTKLSFVDGFVIDSAKIVLNLECDRHHFVVQLMKLVL